LTTAVSNSKVIEVIPSPSFSSFTTEISIEFPPRAARTSLLNAEFSSGSLFANVIVLIDALGVPTSDG